MDTPTPRIFRVDGSEPEGTTGDSEFKLGPPGTRDRSSEQETDVLAATDEILGTDGAVDGLVFDATHRINVAGVYGNVPVAQVIPLEDHIGQLPRGKCMASQGSVPSTNHLALSGLTRAQAHDAIMTWVGGTSSERGRTMHMADALPLQLRREGSPDGEVLE